MKTNAERREVVSRLRAFGETDLGSVNRELWNLIADLIEPESERTCRMKYDTVHHDYVCTACGERYDSGRYASVSDDGKLRLKPMRFCANCGARVVDA